MDQARKMKTVYTVVDRGQKSYWVRVGVGFENQDGSLNLKLDAVPTNGTLQVRDWEAREEGDHGARGRAGTNANANANARPAETAAGRFA
ncbi:MAG: hypothetical protein IPF92_17635 [Myxococcales bacterium]|jgi:hypothetical protein|nr:hypothetical protein [Myxococcales bacterium]